MLIPATQLRVGMIIVMKNDIYRVTDVLHLTPGNWRGMVQVKMKGVKTGSNYEYRFRSEEKVDKAEMEQAEMEYLYTDNENYYFMNTKNYEQVALGKEIVGDGSNYLVQNTSITVDMHDGMPVAVEWPNTVDLVVTETEPGIKSATVTNSFKKAILETGMSIQVPHFINTGDKVKVDTAEGKYLQRVKE